ncbi:hypothetical protein GOSPT_037_00070 [Gordonia sputi NBRC 100414]|uniref:Uncharacterized protein n=1 Tax=Gordonia sputi NBRC 100414 TaxID=1089453 RepID=H5TXN2_9ACTN|nr:hypothetical protein GOSPT_037_00070 [Gordonia sputi NBRC 100414]
MQLTCLAVNRRRHDRSCVHIESYTRTLCKHRGLPQMSDRPGRRLLLGNPRVFVREAPARNPQHIVGSYPYRLAKNPEH